MVDESFMVDDTNLSTTMDNGVSNECGTSMEIVAVNQELMAERQLDEKSPCQDETIDISSPMVLETCKNNETSMEMVLLESISTDTEKQQEAVSPCKGVNSSFSCVEAEQSELIGCTFDSEADAYEAYLRYSFAKCFGIRHSTLRRSTKGDVIGKEFCCSKQGIKADKGVVGKKFTKLDRRTNCKAMVFFKIIDGKYECTRHDMIHNHEFCHPNEVHRLRCHRKVDPSTVKYLLHLKRSGIRLADEIRSLSNEAEEPAIVGFEYSDAAVAVKKAANKKFDCTDCHTLIEILKQRAVTEEDFYYDSELDEDNCLVSVYFRDKIMRKDYEAFSEVLGNDGTYCTNKYDILMSF